MAAQNVVIRECQQAGQAFDIAAEMVRHMESHEIDSNGETIATEETRYHRYQNAELDDVSDPGYWHETREMDGDENHPDGNDQSSDEKMKLG